MRGYVYFAILHDLRDLCSPDQGLSPGLLSESAESSPLDHQGILFYISILSNVFRDVFCFRVWPIFTYEFERNVYSAVEDEVFFKHQLEPLMDVAFQFTCIFTSFLPAGPDNYSQRGAEVHFV